MYTAFKLYDTDGLLRIVGSAKDLATIPTIARMAEVPFTAGEINTFTFATAAACLTFIAEESRFISNRPVSAIPAIMPACSACGLPLPIQSSFIDAAICGDCTQAATADRQYRAGMLKGWKYNQ